MAIDDYRVRFADSALAALMADVPSVFLTGPRGCGKTTTARRHVQASVSLDVPGTAAAAEADPDLFVQRQGRPLLVDEWQQAPAVLGAIKRAVDTDPAPGQFVVTGSVRSELVPSSWPGTGRLVRVQMAPMSQREIVGFGGDLSSLFLHRLFATGEVPTTSVGMTLEDYVDAAVRGGFPEAVRMTSERARRAWLESYGEQLLTRDIGDLGESVDPVRLRQYVEVLALNTAGILAQSSLAQMAGINVITSDRYDQLLTDVGMIENLQPWGRNRVSRVEKRPKRFLTDTGVALASAALDVDSILADGTLLGRVLEGLVFMQFRAEVLAAEIPLRIFHLRTLNGRQEIDFVVEGPGGGVVAVEVKASTRATASDAKHLSWIKREFTREWRAGIVLHAGQDVYPLEDDIWALPISSLWAA